MILGINYYIAVDVWLSHENLQSKSEKIIDINQ